jgi:hypothetical protein
MEDGSTLSRRISESMCVKLVYIHVLGYEVDFGHEVLVLVRFQKYSESMWDTPVSLLMQAWRRSHDEQYPQPH